METTDLLKNRHVDKYLLKTETLQQKVSGAT